MAYASKYYDPAKAHEYYMRTRELKGYENRYGGSRGNGTSAASTPGYSSESKKEEEDPVKKYNNGIRSQISDLQKRISSGELDADGKREVRNQIQALRQSMKGGSTAGLNKKGKEAAAYIKKQMEDERDAVIKKTNKETDKQMLGDVKRLAADIKAMRESGRGFSHKEFLSRINKMLGKTKKIKMASKRRLTAEYKQKYKDEIDKLRTDNSMFTYWDRQAEQDRKRAERERKKGTTGRRRSSRKRSSQSSESEQQKSTTRRRRSSVRRSS